MAAWPAAKAAETAREVGFEGQVTLFSDETVRPYKRPPLSKGFLVGDTPEAELYVHHDVFYTEREIDLRLNTTVTGIDRDAGEVVTADGGRHPFDRLLLATGARPRSLPVDGARLEGVYTLRDIDDSRRLHRTFSQIDRVTVVGAGWIGCEITAAARTLGLDVTMVDPLDVPLRRVLGRKVGAVFADLHRDHGVDLRMGVEVTHILGRDSVEAVRLSDGTTVDTDMVVVGIGAGEIYDRIPYFFSDQYDLGMEYSGHAVDTDRVVIRGDVDRRRFIAFWLDEHGSVAPG